jgi:hypothetical protein
LQEANHSISIRLLALISLFHLLFKDEKQMQKPIAVTEASQHARERFAMIMTFIKNLIMTLKTTTHQQSCLSIRTIAHEELI